MRTIAMPNCCGIQILFSFPFSYEINSYSKGERKIEKQLVKEFLRNAEMELYYQKDKTGASMMQVNLNGNQLKALSGIFQDAGWDIPESFYHSAHRSNITVLSKPLYPDGPDTKMPEGFAEFARNKQKELEKQRVQAVPATRRAMGALVRGDDRFVFISENLSSQT